MILRESLMSPLKIRSKLLFFLPLLVIAVIALAWLAPLPATVADFNDPPVLTPTPAQISWPDSGQSALGLKGYGVLDTHYSEQAAPTASVAKVFTALAVLNKKPLKPGQDGPLITITQPDIDSYNDYYSQDGSLVAVALGEKISERQALEAMLLPSANNMAFTLARWAFGSVDNYIAYANQFNASIGLKHTHIADASGFSSDTVSTPEDLVKIGQLALNNPVLSGIFSEETADVPVAGTIHNTNWLLGVDGINGIKTGNTDAAGGVYLFSRQQIVAGKNVTLIGAIMGAPTLQDALASGRALAATAGNGFTNTVLVKKGQDIGQYRLPWGQSVGISPASDIALTNWYSKNPVVNYSAKNIKSPKTNGSVVGSYQVLGPLGTSTVNLKTDPIKVQIPWRWRLYQRYF